MYAAKEILDKKKETCLKHFGVEHPGQSNVVKEKIKQTCLEKYGADSYLKTEEFKQKSEKTCLEKYGCSNFLEKYQSEDHVNSFSLPEVKEKIKQTCLEKYGVDNYTKTEEFKQKMNNLKNSDDWSVKVKNAQETRKQTSLIRYGKEHHNTLKSWNFIQTLSTVKPLFSFEDYAGSTKKYRWECLKCGTQFESKYRAGRVVRVCPNCSALNAYSSKKEQELADFCSHFYPIKQHDKSLIHPYELDIVIEEIKTALEFNGSFWHNSDIKDKFYHYNKSKMCFEKRISFNPYLGR